MTRITMIYDVAKANGKTARENNLEREHAIPVGTPVEVVPTEGQSEGGGGTRRLYVAAHVRDCDGAPLYALTPRRGERGLYAPGSGYPEEALRRVEAGA